MIRSKFSDADRGRMISILSKSFDDNPSVNDAVKSDSHRVKRIHSLMEYSVEMGTRKNGLWLNDEKNATAVLYDPVSNKDKFGDYLNQVKLVHRSIGWSRLFYMLKKDSAIASHRPKESYLYLFLLGVDPAFQGKGFGGKMMEEIISFAETEKKAIYLETSVDRNVIFYQRLGFDVFFEREIRNDYRMRFMRTK